MHKHNGDFENVVLGLAIAACYVALFMPATLVLIAWKTRTTYIERTIADQARLAVWVGLFGAVTLLIATWVNHLTIYRLNHLRITWGHPTYWLAINELVFAVMYLSAPFWTRLLPRASQSAMADEFHL